MIRPRHVPPGLRALPLHTIAAISAHHHPGVTIHPGLCLVTVDHEAIHAGAECPVTLRLHGAGILLTVLPFVCGERLGTNNCTTQCVTQRRSFDDAEVSLYVPAFGPELSHWNIRYTAQRQISTRVQVVRFERQLQSMKLRQFAQSCHMLFHYQLLGRLSYIPQKAFR